jgi:hypothetical protein
VFQLKTNRFSHGTSPYPPTVPTLGPPILFLRMSLPAPVAAAPNRFSLPWGAIRSFPSEQRRPPHYLALALPLPTDLWPLDPCPPAAAPVTRPHPFASPDPPEWGIGAIGAGAGAATTTMTAAVGGGGGGSAADCEHISPRRGAAGCGLSSHTEVRHNLRCGNRPSNPGGWMHLHKGN